MQLNRLNKIATPYGYGSTFQLPSQYQYKPIISLTNGSNVSLSHNYVLRTGIIFVESDVSIINVTI